MPKALGAAVVDAVGGKPAAGLERQVAAHLAPHRRNHLIEAQVRPAAQRRRHDAHHAPMVGPAHREEQVEAVAPQVDVQLVRHHRPGDLRVGDEEDVLVGRAFEDDAVQVTHRAVCAVAAGHPGGADVGERAVGLFQGRHDADRLLLQPHQLNVPSHCHVPAAQRIAEQPLIVVLPQDQQKRERAQVAADVAQRHACRATTLCPQVGAAGALAEFERLLRDAQLRVDLQRARLYAQRPGLQCRPGVAVDDLRAHAAAAELIGQHQSGRSGTDDEHIGVHGIPPRSKPRDAHGVHQDDRKMPAQVKPVWSRIYLPSLHLPTHSMQA